MGRSSATSRGPRQSSPRACIRTAAMSSQLADDHSVLLEARLETMVGQGRGDEATALLRTVFGEERAEVVATAFIPETPAPPGSPEGLEEPPGSPEGLGRAAGSPEGPEEPPGSPEGLDEPPGSPEGPGKGMRQKKHPIGIVRCSPICFDSPDADPPNLRIASHRLDRIRRGCRCILGAAVSASIERMPGCPRAPIACVEGGLRRSSRLPPAIRDPS